MTIGDYPPYPYNPYYPAPVYPSRRGTTVRTITKEYDDKGRLIKETVVETEYPQSGITWTSGTTHQISTNS